MNTSQLPASPGNFIGDIIDADMASNAYGGRVITRFPPEPNGYLHIGHAKAVCINFGMAQRYGGRCHLRMDDTNPTKESMEYVESIKRDIRWLGFDWGEHFYFSADYFERMYQVAEDLIRRGKAYVCELSMEDWKNYRGVPEKPGLESPFRNRPAEESIALFRRMRAGEFPDGSLCVRSKIDMTSPNLHLRDPVLYRIMRVPHYRTADQWCIYPTYDFAHPLEDAFEGITHSLCSLEFEVHRPLYDWVVAQLDLPYRPHQYEFARLSLTYTVMSKRLLQQLVKEQLVSGWDDPRMPTIAGLRRRGYTPEAIRTFAELVGVTKFTSLTDVALLEYCIRDDLNKRAPRAMAVLRPLKVVILNYPEGQEEEFDAVNNPEDPGMGTRKVPFSRVLYIERDDFREDPPKKFYRLAPGREVRLRYACYITCVDVVKDPATGQVTELHCTYDPQSRGGATPDGRKVRGTLHWVSAKHAREAEIRLYDRLFTVERPADAEDGKDFRDYLNPCSLEIASGYIEPSLSAMAPGARCQFERLGYFCADSEDFSAARPIFNRIVPLKDSWAKIEKTQEE